MDWSTGGLRREISTPIALPPHAIVLIESKDAIINIDFEESAPFNDYIYKNFITTNQYVVRNTFLNCTTRLVNESNEQTTESTIDSTSSFMNSTIGSSTSTKMIPTSAYANCSYSVNSNGSIEKKCCINYFNQTIYKNLTFNNELVKLSQAKNLRLRFLAELSVLNFQEDEDGNFFDLFLRIIFI